MTNVQVLEDFLSVLEECDVETDPRFVAEIFWLAQFLPPESFRGTYGTDGEDAGDGEADSDDDSDEETKEEQKPKTSDVYRIYEQTRQHFEETAPGSKAKLRGGRNSLESLALVRALRPLRRKFRSKQGLILDEESTADESAKTGFVVPVFEPDAERWFSITLVVDQAPSMVLWHKTIREFISVLTSSGAFNVVRCLQVRYGSDEVELVLESGAFVKRPVFGQARREIIIVLSDCTDNNWSGKLLPEIRSWSFQVPVAICQLLPEHLWSHTLLGAPDVSIRSRTPGVANSMLEIEYMEREAASGVPIPVFSMTPLAVLNWASMAMGQGVQSCSGVFVGTSLLEEKSYLPTIAESLSPTERLHRFRCWASPSAFKLACYLAPVPVFLPIMRYVQEKMTASDDYQQLHLAEVFLGGVLEVNKQSSNPEAVEYAFVGPSHGQPGLRDLLLSFLHKREVLAIRHAVSEYAKRELAHICTESDGESLRVLVSDSEGTEIVSASDQPFATVSVELLRQIGISKTEHEVSTEGEKIEVVPRIIVKEHLTEKKKPMEKKQKSKKSTDQKPLTQKQAGQAFEHAVVEAIKGVVGENNIDVIEGKRGSLVESDFETLEPASQDDILSAAFAAIRRLQNFEPQLSIASSSREKLELRIPDRKSSGIEARDMIISKKSQFWEIGIIAKHQHEALKSSRLSKTIDFGRDWLGSSCSSDYFLKTAPIFDRLSDLRQEGFTWSSLDDKDDTIYVPLLEAFREELLRIDQVLQGKAAEKLVRYLIGEHDYYKIVKKLGQEVKIQVFNFNGTLNQPADGIEPVERLKRMSLPQAISRLDFKSDARGKSKTTLELFCDNDWRVSFRLHNASKFVEPSLKFDINLVGIPSDLDTLYVSY